MGKILKYWPKEEIIYEIDEKLHLYEGQQIKDRLKDYTIMEALNCTVERVKI